MVKNKDFSVIVPTYTGAATISGCFESILKQNVRVNIEVIVVIDGPSKALVELSEKYRRVFKEKGIDFRVSQFKKNKGRFEARLHGAKLANSNQLLFLDDRITFNEDYFQTMVNINKQAIMPNVLEYEHPHIVARTLYLLRRKIYGQKWGRGFESYDINIHNFEQSPKGTTSFWIRKKVFISVCGEMKKQYKDLKNINEDTKVMRKIVENYFPIYRSNEAKIYYQPRDSAVAELVHIYKRAPRFIDYYLNTKSRFFMPLLIFFPMSLGGVVVITILAMHSPLLVLVLACIFYLIIGVLIAENPYDVLIAPLGTGLLVVFFGFGLWQSMVRKII